MKKKWFFLAVMSISLLGIISCGVSSLNPEKVVGELDTDFEIVLTPTTTGTAPLWIDRSSTANNGSGYWDWSADPSVAVAIDVSTAGDYKEVKIEYVCSSGTTTVTPVFDASYKYTIKLAGTTTGKVYEFEATAADFEIANLKLTYRFLSGNVDLTDTGFELAEKPTAENFITVPTGDLTGSAGTTSFDPADLWMVAPTHTHTIEAGAAELVNTVVYSIAGYDIEANWLYGGQGANYAIFYSVQEKVGSKLFGDITPSTVLASALHSLEVTDSTETTDASDVYNNGSDNLYVDNITSTGSDPTVDIDKLLYLGTTAPDTADAELYGDYDEQTDLPNNREDYAYIVYNPSDFGSIMQHRIPTVEEWYDDGVYSGSIAAATYADLTNDEKTEVDEEYNKEYFIGLEIKFWVVKVATK